MKNRNANSMKKMNHLRMKRLRKSKKGMSSIAMLMIEIASALFISFIVFTLIQNADENKQSGEAAYTGALAMSKTGVLVNDVTAFSIDSNNTDSEGLIVTVSALPGSDPINLDNTLVYIQIGNRTARLNIRNGTTVKDLENGFYTK
jgi:archaellin